MWNKVLFASEVNMNSLSTVFLSPVGIRVLHSVLGESGIPAQHCQKVHRPEVCPTGELLRHLQNSAFLLHHLLYCQFSFFISFFAFKARCFFLPYSLKLTFLPPHLVSSSWSCLTARTLGRETIWRQSCIESTANSWGWGLLYENRSIIFFYGE